MFTKSSDYGESFSSAIELDSSENSSCQITTNSTGQYVYALWVDGYNKIKMRVSADFGTRWTDIIGIAPSGSNPNVIRGNCLYIKKSCIKFLNMLF